jgi:hypothetical protein
MNSEEKFTWAIALIATWAVPMIAMTVYSIYGKAVQEVGEIAVFFTAIYLVALILRLVYLAGKKKGRR